VSRAMLRCGVILVAFVQLLSRQAGALLEA
jgi:hypothetical protein